MKRVVKGLLVGLASLGIGLGAWWKIHSGEPAAGADAAVAPAVAQVRTERPSVQPLERTLEAFGDVVAAQSAGLSFARAGQLSRLSVMAGDHVRRGAVLAVLTPEPAARQAYQQATDALALAQRELARQQALLEVHLATQTQVDVADKASRDARGALAALDAQDGPLSSSTLAAPFDGVVTSVAALAGDRLQAGANVLQLARADALRILVGLEPAERGRIPAGTHVLVWPLVGAAGALGLPPSAPPLDLVVAPGDGTLDAKTQLLEVVVPVPRALAAGLAPGMKVRTQLRLGHVSAVAVARNAVLSDEQGDYLFQVVGGHAHRVAVARTLDDGQRVALARLDDLHSPVVIEGNHELQEGMAVTEAAARDGPTDGRQEAHGPKEGAASAPQDRPRGLASEPAPGGAQDAGAAR